MIPDVVPKLLLELRDDPDVDDIVSGRVRSPEPAQGDAKGPGEYQAFVVLVELDAPRFTRIPVQRPQVAVRCYGRTHQEASALRWACSRALHDVGSRVHSNLLGIYQTMDTSGGGQESDPDTKQPLQVFIVDVFATTQEVL